MREYHRVWATSLHPLSPTKKKLLLAGSGVIKDHSGVNHIQGKYYHSAPQTSLLHSLLYINTRAQTHTLR